MALDKSSVCDLRAAIITSKGMGPVLGRIGNPIGPIVDKHDIFCLRAFGAYLHRKVNLVPGSNFCTVQFTAEQEDVPVIDRSGLTAINVAPTLGHIKTSDHTQESPSSCVRRIE